MMTNDMILRIHELDCETIKIDYQQLNLIVTILMIVHPVYKAVSYYGLNGQ